MSTRASCLRFAVTRAALGERVVYVCARRDSTRDAFLFAEKLAKRHFTQWVERIYCARWEQQIRFTSGGVVMFPNPQCRNYRGMSSDVLILEYGAPRPQGRPPACSAAPRLYTAPPILCPKPTARQRNE